QGRFVSWVHPALRTFLRLPALAGVLNTILSGSKKSMLCFQDFSYSIDSIRIYSFSVLFLLRLGSS
ncbi:hypothetical protein, partial [Ralstonia pseudosolanacearum]|uniref:hypothetical protein n=1 Tax=Ralstonia pseudosolanacearum TaxID=1310165 RepID=UPI001FF8DA37